MAHQTTEYVYPNKMYRFDWLEDQAREFPLLYRKPSPPVKKISTAAATPKAARKEPNCATNVRNIRSGLRDLFMEFCRQSTIHGISHIGSRQRSLFEKFWWVAVFLLSMFGCGKLIEGIYRKWDENPVIVTFDEKVTPVWAIPFPAVTICSETKVVRGRVNFTELLGRFGEGSLNRTELDNLLATLQLCDEWFFVRPEFVHKFDDAKFSESVVKILRRISLAPNDTMYDCWENGVPCKLSFTESITEEGICMTFNGLNPDEMFRREHLHSDYEYRLETKNGQLWNLENGYAAGSDIFTYPFRGMGSGFQAGMYVQLMSTKDDLEYHCRESQGFKVLLHAPGDYPQVSTKFIRVTLGRDIAVAVKPQIVSTEAALHGYEPIRRQCFFNRERELKFFQVYSQPNCELECLTNFTLLSCDCVPYWMPRSSGTRCCETYELQCALRAQKKLMILNAENAIQQQPGKTTNCNCLPACNSILYDAEITQSIFNFKETMKLRLGPMNISYEDIVEKKILSKLEIYFKDVQFITSKRTEMYGLTDFIANCGGILGLCMGVSLLSLVELLYFSTIRPFMLIRNTMQRKVKIIQVGSVQ